MSKVGEASSESHLTPVLMVQSTFPEGPCPARIPSQAHTDRCTEYLRQSWHG